jgi:protein-S-isoprenylcysteine O-methyltransferase Ste14
MNQFRPLSPDAARATLPLARQLFRPQNPRYHSSMPSDDDRSRDRLRRKSLYSLAAWMLILGVIMFGTAGFGWQRGWIFFLIFWIYTIVSTIYLWRANPEIFVARSKIHQGTKPLDNVFMVLLGVSLIAIFVVASLDARYAWSSVSNGVLILGYGLFTLGYAMSIWVFAVNRFAEPSVRIQSDRGHHVVSTGPYAIVRHPLYTASIILFVGISLAMGSYWALVPVAVGGAVLIARTLFEERILQNELSGYREYTSRVRFRLIPGIW